MLESQPQRFKANSLRKTHIWASDTYRCWENPCLGLIQMLVIAWLDRPAGGTSRCYNEDRSPVSPAPLLSQHAIISTANERSALAAPDQSEASMWGNTGCCLTPCLLSLMSVIMSRSKWCNDDNIWTQPWPSSEVISWEIIWRMRGFTKQWWQSRDGCWDREEGQEWWRRRICNNYGNDSHL